MDEKFWIADDEKAPHSRLGINIKDRMKSEAEPSYEKKSEEGGANDTEMD